MAVQFETSQKETLAAIKEKKHKVFKCKLCDKKSSTRYGLKMHKNQIHPEEGGPEEADRSGKRKVDSVVGRLTKKQTGNTIRTTAGFMVVEKSGENEEPEEPEEAPENKKKTKRRKLSERLQDPIRVKDRSKQVKVNSFRTQTLTLKKKVSRMQREVGTEPDYVILIRNNLQDPHTSNPSASAGKYFVFGEGPIKNKLVKKGIKFDDKEMFLMANNHNFEEEKVSKVRKTNKRINVENNVPRKVATPGSSFLDDPSNRDEDSSESSTSSSSSVDDSSSSDDSSD